jgi:hypothetical protein
MFFEPVLLCIDVLIYTTSVFVITFFALFSSELSFKLVCSQINTLVSIITYFGNDEDLTVLTPCNYLYAGTAALAAVDNYLNLIDTIVVLWKLGSLFLRVFSNSFRYVDMFAGNSKKQNRSP